MDNRKYVAYIDGRKYKVGYPACQGCEHLCFPAPLACSYPGDGCEYPEHRKSAEIMHEFICRVCAVENKVERKRKWNRVSVCPICGERHALFEVVTTKAVRV